MTKDEVAEAVRAWCDAYDTHDIDTIVEMEASSLGFGFRTAAPRARGRIGREQLERFFSGVDYYRLTLESLETDTNGDVGLAWGVFIEHFQHKGQPPERARASPLLKRDDECRGRLADTPVPPRHSAL